MTVVIARIRYLWHGYNRVGNTAQTMAVAEQDNTFLLHIIHYYNPTHASTKIE